MLGAHCFENITYANYNCNYPGSYRFRFCYVSLHDNQQSRNLVQIIGLPVSLSKEDKLPAFRPTLP